MACMLFTFSANFMRCYTKYYKSNFFFNKIIKNLFIWQLKVISFIKQFSINLYNIRINLRDIHTSDKTYKHLSSVIVSKMNGS
jgi:hypothetical protein